jgi:SAM-dependent methyltransferase
MHSWSLLKRSGEIFDAYAPQHEERLHQICAHLANETHHCGYDGYLASRSTQSSPPTISAHQCSLTPYDRTTPLTCCNICGHGFSKTPESDTCPGCTGRARHRQLKDVLDRIGNPFDRKIVLANYANRLEQRAFLSKALRLLNFDVRPVSEVELQMDVQNMSAVRSGSIDTFLALHVLNHVRDDVAALGEIHRVLKKGALACVTIPYRENVATTTLDDVTEHYGQQALDQYGVGTYRRYGLDDALTLFRQHFDVSTEVGTDPVTGQSMQVFFLRKG